MRHLLIILFGLSITSCFGQCPVEITKLGGTGIRGLATIVYLKGTMFKVGSTYTLQLWPEFSNIHTIREGTPVYLNFDDSTSITLRTEKTNVADHSSGIAFVQGTETTIWTNTLTCTPTPEDVLQLKRHKLASIVIEENAYLVNGKKQSLVAGWMKCLDQTK